MASLSFFLPDLVVTVLLALAAFVVGRRLCRRVSFDSTLECAGISTTLGLGTIALSVFLLGLMGMLTRSAVVLGLLGALLACHPVWAAWPRNIREGLRRLSRAGGLTTRTLVLVLLVVAILPILAPAFYPSTAWDATTYHLAMAKAYVHSHRVHLTPFVYIPVFPQLNEILFSVALLFSTDIAAQLVQSLMLGLTALLLYAWGRRIASPRAGLWGVAIWLGTPLVIKLGTMALIDIGLGLFVLAAVYSVSRWSSGDGQSWLVMAGLFAGFASGSKYTALFFLGALAIAALYLGLRHRRWSDPAIFCLAAALTGAPWYIYNAVATGNPVFPFFGQIFGYGLWSADDLRLTLEEMAILGMGKSPLALLRLPWNLMAHPTAFNMNAPLSPFYLLLLPLLLAVGLTRRLRGLLALSLAYVLFWFVTVQGGRYLIPVLPFLSLIAAAGLDRIASRWLPFSGYAPPLGVMFLVAAVLISPGWRYAVSRIAKLGHPPASVSARDAYLARQLPSYPAYKLLNERRGTRYRVYALFQENMAYFADGTFMGAWVGPARYSQITRQLHDARALHAELKRFGADHFLVATDRVNVQLPDDSFFHEHFMPVYTQGSIVLYQLVEER